jgi:hypothetical protein
MKGAKMENLNAEAVKKALECCSKHPPRCKYCPYQGVSCCTNEHRKDALALITSQEQRIKELTVDNERLRKHNITLEQKLMLLGIDDVYVFKAKVKGETANED